MDTTRIRDVLADALAGRHLLTHPFYRRWEAGSLADGELAAYAEQYRLLERQLPLTLAAIAGGLPDGRARVMVQANLADELGEPEPHAALFESFARAAGAAADVAPTRATAELLTHLRSAAASDPVAALAMVAAYEVQAADIAASKSDGLRRHYGMDGGATRFWDLHATQEVAHADWSADALAALGADPDLVHTAARAAADGWWAFLDEREDLAPAAAQGVGTPNRATASAKARARSR
ncbi:MAG: iron-containing redox enzyme family protein [Acidimicrobiales bacterium]